MYYGVMSKVARQGWQGKMSVVLGVLSDVLPGHLVDLCYLE